MTWTMSSTDLTVFCSYNSRFDNLQMPHKLRKLLNSAPTKNGRHIPAHLPPPPPKKPRFAMALIKLTANTAPKKKRSNGMCFVVCWLCFLISEPCAHCVWAACILCAMWLWSSPRGARTKELVFLYFHFEYVALFVSALAPRSSLFLFDKRTHAPVEISSKSTHKARVLLSAHTSIVACACVCVCTCFASYTEFWTHANLHTPPEYSERTRTRAVRWKGGGCGWHTRTTRTMCGCI